VGFLIIVYIIGTKAPDVKCWTAASDQPAVLKQRLINLRECHAPLSLALERHQWRGEKGRPSAPDGALLAPYVRSCYLAFTVTSSSTVAVSLSPGFTVTFLPTTK